MNDEIRLSAREIFADALELKDPAQRERYLAQACGQDAKLRQMVESLLAAHQEAGEFMQPTKVVRPEDLIGEGPGTVIGRYKLLQQIGEGGFGRVFMAEQLEPVQRKVALKIIKAGMDTREVITRFEAERQALALMDHPNIARVLDAGATESGRPYFVMELVKGVKITDYCDQNNLSTDERLDLFIKVCHAVQHAHQKGIIHRDLKPSNVMITLHDGEAVPKVIDFGIAKATGQRLTKKTLFTRYEQMIGTPAYMSPEQAAMSGLDVDTRTDIYALGVLLYELLTGVTPIDKDTLAKVAFEEIRRMIRETEPPKPSTRLHGLGEKLTEVAKQRQTEPGVLQRLVRGDLDWIVMKALEKDRRRRYETANDFAEDIERHLKHEPVVASPPSRLYRFGKLVKRNKLVFAAASVVAAALAVGFGLSAWMFFRERAAKQEQARLRQLAEVHYQTAREAVDGMLTRLATDLAGQPRMTQVRRRLLEDALKFHQDFLKQRADDPELRHTVAETYLRVGDIYQSLGEYAQSLEPWRRALMLLEDLVQDSPAVAQYREEMARACAGIAFASMWLNRSAESLSYQRRHLALHEELQRLFPAAPKYLALTAEAHVDLGNALGVAGRTKESLQEMQLALRFYQEHRARFPNEPEDSVLLAHIQHWLGAALQSLGRLEEAEQAYRQAHDLRTKLVAEHPESVGLKTSLEHIKAYLGEVLAETGRLEEAEQFLQEAIAIVEKVLDEYPDSAERRRAGNDYSSLGRVLWAMHRPQEAEVALRRSVESRAEMARNLPGEELYRGALASSTYNLAVLLDAAGKSEEAAHTFRDAIGRFEDLCREFPESPTLHGYLSMILANCPANRFRDPPRAVKLAEKAVRQAPESAQCWTVLGMAQYRAGDTAAAIEALHKAAELLGGDDPKQWLFLAMAYCQRGNQPAARLWYKKAAAWIEKYHPADEALGRFHAEAERLMMGR